MEENIIREYDEKGNMIHSKNSNGIEEWREYDDEDDENDKESDAKTLIYNTFKSFINLENDYNVSIPIKAKLNVLNLLLHIENLYESNEELNTTLINGNVEIVKETYSTTSNNVIDKLLSSIKITHIKDLNSIISNIVLIYNDKDLIDYLHKQFN